MVIRFGHIYEDGKLTIVYNAADNGSGISNILFEIDDRVVSTDHYQGTLDLGSVDPGTVSIRWIVEDNAGNRIVLINDLKLDSGDNGDPLILVLTISSMTILISPIIVIMLMISKRKKRYEEKDDLFHDSDNI
jgi:hypothetical protein